MSDVECSCGHRWSTRKPLEDIEQLRCSECGTTSREAITIAAEDSADAVTTDSRIVADSKAEAKRKTLQERSIAQLERLEQTATHDSIQDVATELQEEYRQLSELQRRLADEEDTISLDELEDVEEFVDSLVTQIDHHADQLEKVDHLNATISGLQSRISDLTQERNQLEADVAALDTKRDKLRDEVDQLEIAAEAEEARETGYRQGYSDAERHWKIQIPCSMCGELIRIEPNSRKYQAMVDILSAQGWGHPTCRSGPRFESEQPPAEY